MASGALPHKRESPVDDGRFRARGARRREPGCDAGPAGATRGPGVLPERSGSLVQACRSSNAIQEHSRSEQRGCRDFPPSRRSIMEYFNTAFARRATNEASKATAIAKVALWIAIISMII